MVWTPDNPGAGDPDGIRHVARIRAEKAADIRSVVRTMQAAQQQASTADWKAKSREAFVSKIDTVFPDLHLLADGLDAQAAALNRYAAAVEQIDIRLKALQASLSRAQANSITHDQRLRQFDVIPTLHPGQANPGDTPERARERALLASKIESERATIVHSHAQLESLVTERRNADSACAAALDAHAVLGETWKITSAAIKHDSPSQLLALLAGLSATDLRVLFKLHPELAGKLANASDPSAVAAWWDGYGGAEKAAPIGIIPSVIGNLDGVSYKDRNRANLKALTILENQLQKLRSERTHLVGRDVISKFDQNLAAYGYTTATFADAEASVKAIRKSLGSADGLSYQLVMLQNGPPPLAAISIGDMDTASQITTVVPGMGTTVGSSMGSWTGAARNLYLEQDHSNRRFAGGESGLAVVAWIGYDAPGAAPNPEVLSSAKADVGAMNLHGFLGGITAVRGWQAGQNLSLVGHSYGTTVAGLAATKGPIENVTFLASAGLDDSIHSVQDLQVDAHHVWATEAKDDRIANIGRGTVEYGPNPWFGGASLPTAHHVNPTVPSFGAQVFSSEASGSGGGHLDATTGHSAQLQVDAKLDKTTTVQEGYLDVHSTSLFNTALTSLGLGASGLVVTP